MYTFLGIGTNLGDKEANIAHCLQLLRKEVGTLVCCSSVYRSEAWGFESEHDFLNVVAVFDTTLSPKELLPATQSVERQMGRTEKTQNRQYRNRIIDIDILLYGTQHINLPDLKIPHPFILQRDFVRIPLTEVVTELHKQDLADSDKHSL